MGRKVMENSKKRKKEIKKEERGKELKIIGSVTS